MSHNNLKHRTINAVVWSALDKGGVKLLQICISVFLARILSPSDFGVIGMIAIFIAISTLFVDSGFSQALVQKNNPSQRDYSTAFYFNIAVGGCCYLFLFFTAPFIAAFFDTPLLTPVLRVMSITLVTNSLTVVQRAKLLIKLDFKTQSIINLITVLVSGALSVSCALLGWGVWALVVQAVSMGILSTILFWIKGRWLPSIEFSKESFRELFGFGSKLLVAGSVSVIINNIYNIVIGKIYKAQDLGYYTTGRQLSEMSSGSINDVINAVTFPVLSSVKDDQSKMISIYSRMLSMTAFIIIPSMTLITILIKPFVEAILTEKWMPAVVIIQWLCMARLFTPISGLNMNILKAVGRSDLYMKLDLSKLPLTILIMAITLPISVEAVVIGEFIGTFICYFINAYLPGKLFNFGVKAQTKIFSKTLLATLIMSLVTIGTIYFIPSAIVKLIVGSMVGLGSFIIVARVLKIEEVQEIKAVISRIRNRP